MSREPCWAATFVGAIDDTCFAYSIRSSTRVRCTSIIQVTNQPCLSRRTFTVVASNSIVARSSVQTWIQGQTIVFIDLTVSAFIPLIKYVHNFKKMKECKISKLPEQKIIVHSTQKNLPIHTNTGIVSVRVGTGCSIQTNVLIKRAFIHILCTILSAVIWWTIACVRIYPVNTTSSILAKRSMAIVYIDLAFVSSKTLKEILDKENLV